MAPLVFKQMKDVNLASLPGKKFLTFGVFDGVHLAHRALIRGVCRQARKANGQSVVLTFTDHPLRLLAPAYCPKLLTSPDKKLRLIEEMGVDVVIQVAFVRRLANLSAEEFVRRVLVNRCDVHKVLCGFDCRFGRGAEGDIAILRRMAKAYHFEVEVLPALLEGRSPIKSTLVREMLEKGRVRRAARLLQRPHEIRGRVVRGDGVGRSMGYPTANLSVLSKIMLPEPGVYAVGVFYRRGFHGGMLNIGTRPTFERRGTSCEVHLFDFNGDLVGKTLNVLFLRRLRAEQKFPSAEALKQQLRKDEKAAREEVRRHLAQSPPPKSSAKGRS